MHILIKFNLKIILTHLDDYNNTLIKIGLIFLNDFIFWKSVE